MLESLAWWCILDAVLLCPSLLLPEVIPVAWLLERSIAEFFLRRDCCWLDMLFCCAAFYE